MLDDTTEYEDNCSDASLNLKQGLHKTRSRIVYEKQGAVDPAPQHPRKHLGTIR